MAIYSHSKISTFENCPYQYKLKYIDKIKPEIQTTIEAFMGDLVHRTLEKLYKDKKFRRRVSKDILLKYYRELWEKEYSDDILVAKRDQGLTEENYRRMGLKFISDYYDKYKPFEEMRILGLETQDKMTLPDGNQWHVRIDKLGCDSEGNYFVCDYKTNSRMKDQEEADSDRQLAMYSIWVKDKFEDVKSVKLVWYMLAFNKNVTSERTEEQLKKLQNEIVEKIKKIENAKEFPTNVTPLCNYCGFKSICPSFKHQAELEKIKSVKKFKENEGVKLVDEYSKVKGDLSNLKKRENELKENLVNYAKQFDLNVVYGSNMKTSVKEVEKIIWPEGEDKEKFVQLIKDKGLYEDYSTLNYMKLNSSVVKGYLDEEIKKRLNIVKDFRLSLSRRKDVVEE